MRGYLFRNKRNKALKKLKQVSSALPGEDDEMDFLNKEEDFNVDQFFDVK